ncbi:type IV pilus modification PilV family protein [Nitrospina gracilis]|uniref:type IV pilus modification PilV family protein n=1 Tax=Nitrospina gracilis TaxID=35801 RepID=UPI001F2EB37A|nr:type II secretion system protein [Nitrospina gracilis]MCF8721124.1 prepilin-type N-terminal cleavage/methylation domain-containing protein [Nitrospina gracilis Nb-211]
MEPRENHTNNESGFTLIELLIGMAILVMGLLTVNFFLGNLLNKSGHLESATLATTLAAERLEDLKSQALTTTLTNANNGSDNLDADGNPGGSKFTRTWTISGTSDQTDIVVTVSWERSGVTESRTLQTRLNQD